MKRRNLVNIISNYIYQAGVESEEAMELGEKILSKLESKLKLEVSDQNGEYKILKVNGQKLCGCCDE